MPNSSPGAAAAAAAAADSTDNETLLRAQLADDPAQHTHALALADLLLGDGRVHEAIALLIKHAEDRGCGDRLREYYIGERMNDAAQRLLEQRLSEASASGLVDQALRCHLRGDLEGAVTRCQLAQKADDQYAPARNHLGRALFNMRQPAAAGAAFVHAVRLDPHYAEAWHNLAHTLRDAQDWDQAERSYGHALRLRPAYRSALLNLGIVRAALGKPEQALQSFQAVLALDPANADAYFNSGLCQHLLRQYDDAEYSYQRAIELDPRNPRAHLQLGRLHNERLDTENALKQFRLALDLNSRDAEAWAEIAIVYEQTNRLEDAARAVTAGLLAVPGDPGLQLEHAKLARRNGDANGALRGLRAIDHARLNPRLHQQFQYELGWSLDRAGEHAQAVAAFDTANALASRSPRAQNTDMQAFDRQLDAIEAWLQQDAQAAALGADEDSGEDLCFLLGFPRSGTTLLDVMLDGHPDVASIEEQPTIEVLAQSLTAHPAGYPAALADLDRSTRDALREQYRDSISALFEGGTQGARLIVDKMPIRTVHAAFIQHLFPKARFLFALRHPCDVVLSNYMQQYAANEVFVHFYTLTESVRVYDRVMKIWEDTLARLPLRSAYVRYEELIADPDRVLREACTFLDLAWNADLAAHQANLKDRQRIATNSYGQVAEPIYTRAVGRWLDYRGALNEFLPVLRPHAEYFGYAID
jgi:tetratricopeptide (TPR) repeat protein